MAISKDNMNHLIDFIVHKDMESDNRDGGEPTAKHMRVQLSGELSKNKLLRMYNIKKDPKLVDSGILDDTPPTSYTPLSEVPILVSNMW